MKQHIYLDYNATSPMRPEIKKAFYDACDIMGNPSSVHFFGRQARKEVENAREKIASYCGVAARNVIFTGSATEANHLVLRGTKADILLIPEDEHDCILEAAKLSGKQVIPLKLLPCGEIDIAYFDKIFYDLQTSGKSVLASIMKVNNETGRIKDLSYISGKIREIGGILHSDAVQAFGKIPFDNWSWQTDSITIAAHKVGGPKGIGVLILKDNILCDPLITGGGQEMRRRAGTENIPAIITFSAMIDFIPQMMEESEKYRLWRDKIINHIQNENKQSKIACLKKNTVSNTISVMSPQMPSEKQVILADLSSIALSSGSACSSGKVKQSHVLRAYGYDNQYSSSNIRISLGFNNVQGDIEVFKSFYLKIK